MNFQFDSCVSVKRRYRKLCIEKWINWNDVVNEETCPILHRIFYRWAIHQFEISIDFVVDFPNQMFITGNLVNQLRCDSFDTSGNVSTSHWQFIENWNACKCRKWNVKQFNFNCGRRNEQSFVVRSKRVSLWAIFPFWEQKNTKHKTQVGIFIISSFATDRIIWLKWTASMSPPAFRIHRQRFSFIWLIWIVVKMALYFSSNCWNTYFDFSLLFSFQANRDQMLELSSNVKLSSRPFTFTFSGITTSQMVVNKTIENRRQSNDLLYDFDESTIHTPATPSQNQFKIPALPSSTVSKFRAKIVEQDSHKTPIREKKQRKVKNPMEFASARTLFLPTQSSMQPENFDDIIEIEDDLSTQLANENAAFEAEDIISALKKTEKTFSSNQCNLEQSISKIFNRSVSLDKIVESSQKQTATNSMTNQFDAVDLRDENDMTKRLNSLDVNSFSQSTFRPSINCSYQSTQSQQEFNGLEHLFRPTQNSCELISQELQLDDIELSAFSPSTQEQELFALTPKKKTQMVSEIPVQTGANFWSEDPSKEPRKIRNLEDLISNRPTSTTSEYKMQVKRSTIKSVHARIKRVRRPPNANLNDHFVECDGNETEKDYAIRKILKLPPYFYSKPTKPPQTSPASTSEFGECPTQSFKFDENSMNNFFRF